MKKFGTKLSMKFKPKMNRKNCIFLIFSILAISLIIVKMPGRLNAKELIEFNRDLKNYNVKLQILNQNQDEIAKFMIAIADTEYKKMYGLMNLSSLPATNGMLFPFIKNEVVAMWMKNTKIPLDMIFLDNEGVIVNIKANTTPYSTEIISSEKPAKKVLEINAGLVKKFGIKIGQQIKVSQ